MPLTLATVVAAVLVVGVDARGGSLSGCTRTSNRVTVELSRSRYPETTLHLEIAWKQGVTRRYTIARNRADRNRDAWQPYVPSGVDANDDGKKDDRDEVPMAFTRQGSRKAANGRSASHSPMWTQVTIEALEAPSVGDSGATATAQSSGYALLAAAPGGL